MEDTHGVGEIINDYLSNKFVLILIIMEDTHGVFIYRFEHNVPVKVLILIIMEDTHGVICNICFNIY